MATSSDAIPRFASSLCRCRATLHARSPADWILRAPGYGPSANSEQPLVAVKRAQAERDGSGGEGYDLDMAGAWEPDRVVAGRRRFTLHLLHGPPLKHVRRFRAWCEADIVID